MDSGLLGQALQFHGPELVRNLQVEQQQVPNNVQDFLHRYREHPPESTGMQMDLDQKIKSFMARKADFLFKNTEDSSRDRMPISEDDTYAKMPPIESFMGVDNNAARQHFFNSLERFDIVIGVVTTVIESGLVLTLLCMDNDKARDIDEMKITAFCPIKELPRVAYQSPTEGFTVKDKVRGVVVNVNSESERIIVSLHEKSLSEEQEHIKLGLINTDDFPVQYRRKLHIRGLTFDELLHSILGFNNIGNVPFLLDVLNLEDSSSYMRGLHKLKFPEKECAIGLRRQQSQKWAHQSVADGIKMFKSGKQMEAMQYLNKALQIDPENVEAYTARGALYANNESYHKALEDFEEALSINPQHQNARKYMYETLLAVARVKEDNDNFEDAENYIRKALTVDPHSMEAREALRFLFYKKDQRELSLNYRRRQQENKGDSDDEFDRTKATLKKLINDDQSRSSENKRRDKSPQRLRSRQLLDSPERTWDIFGSHKYDGIPGLDIGEEQEKESFSSQYKISPSVEKALSRSSRDSPSRDYNIDHQSSFMKDQKGYFEDDSVSKGYENKDQKRSSEDLFRSDRYLKGEEKLGSRKVERSPEKEEIDLLYGDIDVDLDGPSKRDDKLNFGLTQNLMRIAPKPLHSKQEIKKEFISQSPPRERNVSPDDWKARSDKFLEAISKGKPLSAGAWRSKSRSLDRSFDKSYSSDDEKKIRKKSKEGKLFKKTKKRKNSEKEKKKVKMEKRSRSLSPAPKYFKRSMSPEHKSGEKLKKINNKDGKEYRDSHSFDKDFVKKGKASADESDTSSGRKIKSEKKKKKNQPPSEPKLDKDNNKDKKIREESVDEVVKSKWDSPSDENYYSALKKPRRSRFDSEEQKVEKSVTQSNSKFRNTFEETNDYKEKTRVPHSDAKFRNTFKETDKKEKARAEEKLVTSPQIKRKKRSSPERMETPPRQKMLDPLPRKKMSEPVQERSSLPSKEEIDREFEGIRIHIRNDKYGTNIQPVDSYDGKGRAVNPGQFGSSGIRPFDSIEEDPANIVSAIHSDALYKKVQSDRYEKESLSHDLSRENDMHRFDDPRLPDGNKYQSGRGQNIVLNETRSESKSYQRSRVNYRKRRSESSSSSSSSSRSRSRSRSGSYDRGRRSRSHSYHKKHSRSRSRSYDRSKRRPYREKRSRSYEKYRSHGQEKPKERVMSGSSSHKDRGSLSKLLQVNKYNRNRFSSDGKNVIIKPFKKYEGNSRGGSSFRGRGDTKFDPKLQRGGMRGRGRGSYNFRGGFKGSGSKQYVRSPRHHSRSPRHHSRSPRHWSKSPRRRSRSPKHRSRSPRQRSRSPRHRSRSPRHRSRSPRHRSKSCSPPIGQGGSYYWKDTKEKQKQDIITVIANTDTAGNKPPEAGNNPSGKETSSLEQMETFLEQLKKRKMQTAANNSF